MKTFCVNYWLDGKEFSIHVQADSWEDAERHVSALSGAKVDGELIGTIPANLSEQVLSIN